MAAQLHLLQMLFNTPISHLMLTWADEHDGQLAGMQSFAYWQDIARTLEKACFDGVFFADTAAVHDQYKDSPLTSVKYGVNWPTHDPMPLIAVMAAATQRLGFGVTLSTAGTAPYLAVRRISTLDYMTKGRVAWNIVTGFSRAEHRAVGGPVLSHDERYDFADEYMAICYALWDCMQPGAIVADREKLVFANLDKIRTIDFKGKYLHCQAVVPTMPSPQGRPLLFQAGSSPRGMTFAARHADVVFAIQPTVERMRAFIAKLHAASREIGRPEDEVKALFGIQPVVGSTEEEAKRKVEKWLARVPLEAALSRLSGTLGVDLSKFDPDQPFSEMSTEASQGMMAAFGAASGGTVRTLREAAINRNHFPRLIGTPAQVADRIETIWRETGCHGFNISPTVNPGGVADFAEQVVPILQKRGIFRREYEGSTFRAVLS